MTTAPKGILEQPNDVVTPKCSCWIGRGDYGGWAPDRIACAVHGDFAQLAKALQKYAEWCGAVHDDGCPEDDTCDCSGKWINDGVNEAVRFFLTERPTAATSSSFAIDPSAQHRERGLRAEDPDLSSPIGSPRPDAPPAPSPFQVDDLVGELEIALWGRGGNTWEWNQLARVRAFLARVAAPSSTGARGSRAEQTTEPR